MYGHSSFFFFHCSLPLAALVLRFVDILDQQQQTGNTETRRNERRESKEATNSKQRNSQKRLRKEKTKGSYLDSMDHFKNLGLSEDASIEEVKAAYRRLAKISHPDVNKLPGAAEKFKLICTSYEILKNEETRAKYILEKGYGGGDEEWNRGNQQQYRTNYNDVRADFDRASEKMKSEHRTKFKLMAMFEHLIHPRTLFVVVPTGIFTYWVMSSVFSRNKGTIQDDGRNPSMTVSAWKNPKTNRYEQPAPWDDEYKKYIATTPLVQIDRSLVMARDPKQ